MQKAIFIVSSQKNGINNEVLGNPNVVIPVNAPTAMGIAHRAKVATIANGLEVETGGKSYLLAGGMGATTAFGLLHDLSKVMGLAIHQSVVIWARSDVLAIDFGNHCSGTATIFTRPPPVSISRRRPGVQVH